jgi:hypothetical protein
MLIIGCDFHPGFQQIAMLDTESGEVRDLRLVHQQEARQFYAGLQGKEVLVGVEACGYTQWFEQMLEQLGHRVRIGDAAAIRASYVRKRKTDRRDAGHILRLLVEAAHGAVRGDAELSRCYRRLQHRHSTGVAKVAVARKLALRLYWMLCAETDYAQLRVGPYAGKPESFCGRKTRPVACVGSLPLRRGWGDRTGNHDRLKRRPNRGLVEPVPPSDSENGHGQDTHTFFYYGTKLRKEL